MSLYLLHEGTGHPLLPRVMLAQKTHVECVSMIQHSDAVAMVPRGLDIGPTSPMGPSPWLSWNARSHGHLHKGQPLCIHTYTCIQIIVGLIFIYLLWPSLKYLVHFQLRVRLKGIQNFAGWGLSYHGQKGSHFWTIPRSFRCALDLILLLGNVYLMQKISFLNPADPRGII